MKRFLRFLQLLFRFSGNVLLYPTGLGILFTGVWLHDSFALALIVIGTIVVSVSIATSFFVTWLSAKETK